MELFYNGVNITERSPIIGVSIEDDCGVQLDSLKVIFNDAGNLWTSFYPKRNDILEVKCDGYSTGDMYVDDVNPREGKMILQALPVRASIKTKKTKAWENITLPILGHQKAVENNLAFSAISVSPYVYKRTDQQNESDLAFLDRICVLERSLLKLHNGSLTIYSEEKFSQNPPVKKLLANQMSNKNFKNTDRGCCSGYSLSYGGLTVTAYDQTATDCQSFSRSDIQFFSIAEGERFSSNLLYSRNKNKTMGSFETPLDMSVAAGNILAIADMGMFNGNYFINHVTHMPLDGVSLFEVRRVTNQ